MRPTHAPDFRPDAPRRSTTRGVRFLPLRPGRPNPHGVEWSEFLPHPVSGQLARRVRRKWFPTAEQAQAHAANVARAKRSGALRTLSRAEVDDFLAFRAAIGLTPWPVVVAAWREQRARLGLVDSQRTVRDAVADYLGREEARVDRHELARGTFIQRRHKLGLFSADFGPRLLGTVTTADLSAWLDRQPVAVAATFNNWLKILRGFFAAAVDARELPHNPCTGLRPRVDVRDEVGILTVPQLAALFHTARTWSTDGGATRPFALALRRLALEAFAGVRFSSACRLTAADILAADRGIRHPATSIKTRRRHYVEGYPDVLWAWLALAPDDAALTPRRYLALKSDLFRAARVPHPHNCLRHSFATYHLAAVGNAGLTAVLLCHRSQEKLWSCYKGNASGAEGRRWLALLPEIAAKVAAEAFTGTSRTT